MKFLRFISDDGEVVPGWLSDQGVGRIYGDFLSEFRREEPTVPLDQIKLSPPINPGKIICLGRNYSAHAEEHGVEVPKLPLIFLKPPSSIIAHEETILLPPQSSQIEHEAELAVIIGRDGKHITPENALIHVFGYSIANDVTARDLQVIDNQWTRAKGFDSFCPLGPWIETEFNHYDAQIRCTVNGVVRQLATTRDMVFDISNQIAYISSIMTLNIGDVILTGTPSGVGPLLHGDVVDISIAGIGTLRNNVKSLETIDFE